MTVKSYRNAAISPLLPVKPYFHLSGSTYHQYEATSRGFMQPSWWLLRAGGGHAHRLSSGQLPSLSSATVSPLALRVMDSTSSVRLYNDPRIAGGQPPPPKVCPERYQPPPFPQSRDSLLTSNSSISVLCRVYASPRTDFGGGGGMNSPNFRCVLPSRCDSNHHVLNSEATCCIRGKAFLNPSYHGYWEGLLVGIIIYKGRIIGLNNLFP